MGELLGNRDATNSPGATDGAANDSFFSDAKTVLSEGNAPLRADVAAQQAKLDDQLLALLNSGDPTVAALIQDIKAAQGNLANATTDSEVTQALFQANTASGHSIVRTGEEELDLINKKANAQAGASAVAAEYTKSLGIDSAMRSQGFFAMKSSIGSRADLDASGAQFLTEIQKHTGKTAGEGITQKDAIETAIAKIEAQKNARTGPAYDGANEKVEETLASLRAQAEKADDTIILTGDAARKVAADNFIVTNEIRRGYNDVTAASKAQDKQAIKDAETRLGVIAKEVKDTQEVKEGMSAGQKKEALQKLGEEPKNTAEQDKDQAQIDIALEHKAKQGLIDPNIAGINPANFPNLAPIHAGANGVGGLSASNANNQQQSNEAYIS